MRVLFAAVVICLLNSPVLCMANDYALLIGGGPTPKESQVSIESNVIWIDKVLNHHGFSAKEVHFTSGADSVPDVHYQIEPQDLSPAQQALTRVFGEENPKFSVYRGNQIPVPVRRATRKEVVADLFALLNNLHPDDNLWIIYSGHGGWAETADKTTLRLWNEERLTADEFCTILLSAKAGVNIRFFLPQCHSGGFIDTLIKKMTASIGEIRSGPNICGFAAAPFELGSEGCTISVDSGDYRDYGGYFFAALVGGTSSGRTVAKDVRDFDKDGRISLQEAHLYAIYGSTSSDLPRSTSEIFLEAWQPWFLRWMSYGTADSRGLYAGVAEKIADSVEIDGSGLAAARQAQTRIQQIGKQVAFLEPQIKERKDSIQSLQKLLKQQLLLRWPQLEHPYNNDFLILTCDKKQGDMDVWFASSPDYKQLVENQNLLHQQENEMLSLKRKQATFLRLKRMVLIDRLQGQLARYGSTEEMLMYQKLQRCEAWVPSVGNSRK